VNEQRSERQRHLPKVTQLARSRGRSGVPVWCCFSPTPPLQHPLPQANALIHIFTQLFIQQILIECILCLKSGPWSKVQIKSAGSPSSTIPKTFLVAVNASTCWGFLGSFHKSSIFHDWSQSDLGPVPVPGQRFSIYRMGFLPETQ